MGVDLACCDDCEEICYETVSVYRMKPKMRLRKDYRKTDPDFEIEDCDSDCFTEEENYSFPYGIRTDQLCEDCCKKEDVKKSKQGEYYWGNISRMDEMCEALNSKAKDLERDIDNYEKVDKENRVYPSDWIDEATADSEQDSPADSADVPLASEIDGTTDKKRKSPSSELADPQPVKK